MIQQIRDNALLIQAYIDFKRKFEIDNIEVADLIIDGFIFKSTDQKSNQLLLKSQLDSITIKNNF